MNVGELAGEFLHVERDDTDENVPPAERRIVVARVRVDETMPVVLVIASADGGEPEAYEVDHFVTDSGQAQIWVGAPAVLSHKITGAPKPDQLATAIERIADLERRLNAQESPAPSQDG